MQRYGWVEDDCMSYVIPSFSGYCVCSEEDAGLRISVLECPALCCNILFE